MLSAALVLRRPFGSMLNAASLLHVMSWLVDFKFAVNLYNCLSRRSFATRTVTSQLASYLFEMLC